MYLLETKPNIFGYASPDEDQGSRPRKRAYLVLDNDFEEFANPPTLTALEAMQATMAHEYNHVLQFAYDSLEDLWMFEAGATWAEEYVYPDIDDYLNYVDGFARSSEVSLTTNDPSGEKIYGAAVWNHYLSGVYDPDEVREAWAVSKQVFPAHLSVGAYDNAIGGDGDNPFETLGDEFVRFASSTAEWRALPGLYPDATELPKVARAGEVTATEDRRPFLDHLSYALIEVEPPESGPIKVTVRGPKGVHYGADLVGRLGTATGGTVVSQPAPRRRRWKNHRRHSQRTTTLASRRWW